MLIYIDKREAEFNEAKPATEAKGPGCRQKRSWQVQDPWPFDMAWAQQVMHPKDTYRRFSVRKDGRTRTHKRKTLPAGHALLKHSKGPEAPGGPF